MKRLFFTLFCTLFTISIALAQQARIGDFTIRGTASQDLKVGGLVGAHQSLPLNSIVKVTNPKNGREAEITIIGRIEASQNRIIDLSPTVTHALQMKAGDQVVLTVSTPLRPVTARQQDPIIELSEPMLISQDGTKVPVSEITTANGQTYIVQTPQTPQPQQIQQTQLETPSQPQIIFNQTDQSLPEQPILEQKRQAIAETPVSAGSTPRDSSELKAMQDFIYSKDPKANDTHEFYAWLMAMTLEARDSREAREIREARDLREAREAREFRESREQREAREAREIREARELRDEREAKEMRDARQRREARQDRDSLINRNQVEPNGNGNPAVSNQPINNRSSAERQNEFAPLSEARPFSTSINSLVPDLRVAANQTQPVKNPGAALSPPPVKADKIHVIPGLPNRNDNKIYSLQVGAFSVQSDANRAAQLLNGAGFEVKLDFSGSIYRVMAVKIPSADVYNACVRLGSLGFGQIWVRE